MRTDESVIQLMAFLLKRNEELDVNLARMIAIEAVEELCAGRWFRFSQLIRLGLETRRAA